MSLQAHESRQKVCFSIGFSVEYRPMRQKAYLGTA